MKKPIFTLIMLIVSLQIAAQNSTRLRYLQHYEGNHEMRIELNKYNQLYIELDSLNDLKRYRNIDSLLRIFVKDYKEIGDTLNSIDIRKVEYNLNNSPRRMMNIKRYGSTTESYSFGLSTNSVKNGQDTLYISLQKFAEKDGRRLSNRFSYILIINRLEDIEALETVGINDRIETLIDRIENGEKGNLFETSQHLYSYWTESAMTPKLEKRHLPRLSVLSGSNIPIGLGFINGQATFYTGVELPLYTNFIWPKKSGAYSWFYRSSTFSTAGLTEDKITTKSAHFTEFGIIFYEVERQIPTNRRSAFKLKRVLDLAIGYTSGSYNSNKTTPALLPKDTWKLGLNKTLNNFHVGIDFMTAFKPQTYSIGLRLGINL